MKPLPHFRLPPDLHIVTCFFPQRSSRPLREKEWPSFPAYPHPQRMRNHIWKLVFGTTHGGPASPYTVLQPEATVKSPASGASSLGTAGVCFLEFQGLGLIASQMVGMCETVRLPDTKVPVLPFISVQTMKVMIWLFWVGEWGEGGGGERNDQKTLSP